MKYLKNNFKIDDYNCFYIDSDNEWDLSCNFYNRNIVILNNCTTKNIHLWIYEYGAGINYWRTPLALLERLDSIRRPRIGDGLKDLFKS